MGPRSLNPRTKISQFIFLINPSPCFFFFPEKNRPVREEREMGSDSEVEKSAQKEKKKIFALAPIAKPLAGKKLNKRIFKLVRRAAEKKCLKRGVKEVVKSIRRGQKGVCVIAGNISPIDVITHVPILCEEADIPYIYVSSKEDLANAGATKRPTCCILVQTKPAKGELSQEDQEKLETDYDQVVSEVGEMASSMF
ncbi:H/ACA ribonucleoprotein complex subunit 2-like protein [Solanum dulcamara]|uniref:H/ACA ribonucleoprotein complex subunit 2-like protein n=1 Tax=Solanum dulcamara TaxID=45834 RepID=UPI002485890B|nr:H/ACA ribonucleoprotein complex subunit 2-like protein [Solanum dulcamara]